VNYSWEHTLVEIDVPVATYMSTVSFATVYVGQERTLSGEQDIDRSIAMLLAQSPMEASIISVSLLITE